MHTTHLFPESLRKKRKRLGFRILTCYPCLNDLTHLQYCLQDQDIQDEILYWQELSNNASVISYYLFWERQIHAPQAVQSGSKPQAPQEDKELISASITFSVRYANTLSKTLPDSLFTVLLLRAPTRDTAPVTRDQRFASILPFLQTAIRQHRDAEMSVSSQKSPVSKEIW